jgi:hypothetical protein
MAQQDYGAAEPIMDLGRRALGAYNRLGQIGSPPRDTSWHDDMVRKATASFAQPAAPTTPPTPPKRVPRRTPPTRTPARAAAAKRR